MEHIFLIDDSEDTGYRKHVLEALSEFLDLFPEHKNEFKFHIRIKDKFFEIPANEITKDNPTLTEIKYSDYEKTTMLSRTEGEDCWSVNDWMAGNAQNKSYFHYVYPTRNTIDREAVRGSSVTLGDIEGMGVSENVSDKYKKTSYVTVRANMPPNRFKSILKHELGHAFNATHEGRANTKVYTDTGNHCTNEGCLMEDGRVREANEDRQPEFCEDCINAMQQYMKYIFEENTNPNSNAITVHDSEEDLPQNQEPDDTYKLSWIAFVRRLGIDYHDNTCVTIDEESDNFSAKIKRPNGETISIVASSSTNVVLSSKKPDGTPQVPDQKVFDNLVSKAYRDNKEINFGEIKSPEFKARLMLACLNKGIKMQNCPDVQEVLSSLDDNNPTKASLISITNRVTQQPNDNTVQRPVNPIQNANDCSR